jgi:hypothetical protein
MLAANTVDQSDIGNRNKHRYWRRSFGCLNESPRLIERPNLDAFFRIGWADGGNDRRSRQVIAKMPTLSRVGHFSWTTFPVSTCGPSHTFLIPVNPSQPSGGTGQKRVTPSLESAWLIEREILSDSVG